MNLSHICIKNPVLAIVISLLIAILGFVGLTRLQLRFFPDLVQPVVTIRTYYTGANADLMESQVTSIIENALAGLNNVQSTSSSSSTGYSRITVQFNLGGNFESEAANVRDSVASIRDKLPANITSSTITVGSEAAEVMDIGITDPYKSAPAIRDYTAYNLVPFFRQIPGVGAVGIAGSSSYALRIWLDPMKMAALNLTVTDVTTALTNNNLYFSAGAIKTANKNYSLVSHTQLKNINQFKKIIVLQNANGVVRLSDIAKIKLGTSSTQAPPMIINGKEGVKIYIDPLQSANPITVATNIKKQLKQLQTTLPAGMKAFIIYDQSIYTKASINETIKAIFEAIALVIIVILIFLGSLRSALIPIITIPLSLTGVLAIIYILGFSLNVMSLLAMVLAIGLVVDDAIVMLENIYRHIEEGLTPFEAALLGSKELFYAIITMSITLVAVYAPIGMVQGVNSELFQQFAFTLAGAVLISAFIALTLSPMMASTILKPNTNKPRFAKAIDHTFEKITKKYDTLLAFLLNKKILVFIFLAVIAGVGFIIVKSMPSEFLPQEDYGIIDVSVGTPTGSNLGYTKKYLTKINNIMEKTPNIKSMYTQVNAGSISIRATLTPFNKRTLTTQQIVNKLNAQFTKIPGVTASAYVANLVNYGAGGSDLTYYLLTTLDYPDLVTPINTLMTRLKQNPKLQSIGTNLRYDSQEYAITINRDLASTVGISLSDIATTITTFLSSAHVGDLQSGAHTYNIILQANQSELSTLDVIKHIFVKTAADANGVTKMIPLSNLVTVKPTIGQGSLTHYNRMRAGYITARLAPGYSESQAINYLNNQLPGVLGQNTKGAYAGKAQQFIQSAGTMTNIIILSFVFIYLLLSAQFGSFIDPFIILFAVPFSIVGALVFLWIGNGSLNLYSEIGMVTLIGLISKHGILITQFINQLRAAGKPLQEAIIEGASIRFRPILMTTAAMVFGTLPLAFASGAGSIGRHEIGWVVVGGLLCGTFFSLIVVPVMYHLLGRFKSHPAQNEPDEE